MLQPSFLTDGCWHGTLQAWESGVLHTSCTRKSRTPNSRSCCTIFKTETGELFFFSLKRSKYAGTGQEIVCTISNILAVAVPFSFWWVKFFLGKCWRTCQKFISSCVKGCRTKVVRTKISFFWICIAWLTDALLLADREVKYLVLTEYRILVRVVICPVEDSVNSKGKIKSLEKIVIYATIKRSKHPICTDTCCFSLWTLSKKLCYIVFLVTV